MAVSAGGGDGRSGGDDGRQRRVGHRGVAQPEGQVAAVAQIPHGGHPATSGPPGGGSHRREHFGVVAVGEVTHRIVGRVEGQMDVAVDQAGQECRTVEIDHGGAVGSG